MIEKTLRTFLVSALSRVPIVFEQPKTKTDKFVLIERTGGGKENQINSATVAIQSYDTTMQKAAELNDLVKEKMELFGESSSCLGCVLNSDYNFTDTETKRYRYQAVFDIYY